MRNQQEQQPALFVGIDWADQKHDCYVIDRDGNGFLWLALEHHGEGGREGREDHPVDQTADETEARWGGA